MAANDKIRYQQDLIKFNEAKGKESEESLSDDY